MSDKTAAARIRAGEAWLGEHVRRYLDTGGREGHIMDMAFSEGETVDLSYTGHRAFRTHLLLQTIGRRSGRSYLTPLFYMWFGGEVVIVASKAGADHHPDWYHNLVARDEVRFQLAAQAFSGTWREADGDERESVWALLERSSPSFARYRAGTERRIPVVLMTPRAEIPVFTPAGVGASSRS